MHWTGGGSNQLVSYILCLIYLKSLNPNSLSLAAGLELTMSRTVIGRYFHELKSHWYSFTFLYTLDLFRCYPLIICRKTVTNGSMSS